MSSGQSARNGNSVEPGLPNTFLMPKARSRPKVASLTLTDLLAVLAGLRDDMSGIPGMSQSSLRGRNGRGGSNDGYSLRRHSGRRNHLDVKRNLPTFGKAHARRRVSRARTFQHEAVIGIVHYFIALLHIDWKAADVGHEHAGSSGNVGSDIPGAASRTQRNRRDLVDVGHPGVLVGLKGLDAAGADIAHVAEAIGQPVDMLFDRLDHARQHRRAAGTGDHEEIWESR